MEHCPAGAGQSPSTHFMTHTLKCFQKRWEMWEDWHHLTTIRLLWNVFQMDLKAPKSTNACSVLLFCLTMLCTWKLPADLWITCWFTVPSTEACVRTSKDACSHFVWMFCLERRVSLLRWRVNGSERVHQEPPQIRCCTTWNSNSVVN